MTLQLNTAGGMLTLGRAPRTHIACAFCGCPAQVRSTTPERTVNACTDCTEDALRVAASLADTPGEAA